MSEGCVSNDYNVLLSISVVFRCWELDVVSPLGLAALLLELGGLLEEQHSTAQHGTGIHTQGCFGAWRNGNGNGSRMRARVN